MSKNYRISQIVFIFLSLFFLSACFNKPTERLNEKSSLDVAKENPQQRNVPFNTKAPDQLYSPGQALPTDPDLEIGELENSLKYYLKSTRSNNDLTELRLYVESKHGFNIKAIHQDIPHGDFEIKKKLIANMEQLGWDYDPSKLLDIYEDHLEISLSTASSDQQILVHALGALKDFLLQIKGNEKYLCKEEANERSNLIKIRNLGPAGDDVKLLIIGNIEIESVKEQVDSIFSPLKIKMGEENQVKDSGDSFTTLSLSSPANDNIRRIALNKSTSSEVIRTQRQMRQHVVRHIIKTMLEQRLKDYTYLSGGPFTEAKLINEYRRSKDEFLIDVHTFYGDEQKAIEKIRYILDQIVLLGFSESEIKFAKEELLRRSKSNQRAYYKSSNSFIADQMGKRIIQNLPLLSPSQIYSFNKVLIPQISQEELSKEARVYLDFNQLSVIVANDISESEQQANEKLALDAWFKKRAPLGNDEHSLNEFSGFKIIEQDRKAVIKNERIENINVNHIVLENGAALYLKGLKKAKDKVHIFAFRENLDSDFNQDYIDLLPIIAKELFYAGYDEPALRRYLETRKLNFTPFISEDFHGFKGSCSPEDLQILFQLMEAYLTNEGIIQENLINNKKPISYYLERKEASDTSSINKHGIDLSFFWDFYKRYFTDIQGYSFIFTGSLNTHALVSRAQKYIGNLPIGAENSEMDKKFLEKPPSDLASRGNWKTLEWGTSPGIENFEEDQLFILSKVIELAIHKTLFIEGLSIERLEVLLPNFILDQKERTKISFICNEEDEIAIRTLIEDQIERLKKGELDSPFLDNCFSRLQVEAINLEEDHHFWIESIKKDLIRYGKVSSKLTEVDKNYLLSVEPEEVKEMIAVIFESQVE